MNAQTHRTEELLRRLNEVIERLRAALSPRAIYLHGSLARGDAGPQSDIDLIVIVDDSPLDPYERDAIAYRALGNLPVPVDVQVYTVSEFEQRAAKPVTFEHVVKTQGKLVYAA